MKKAAVLIVALGFAAPPSRTTPHQTDGVTVCERDAHIWVADTRMHNERELAPGSRSGVVGERVTRIAFTFGGGIFTISPDGEGTSQADRTRARTAASPPGLPTASGSRSPATSGTTRAARASTSCARSRAHTSGASRDCRSRGPTTRRQGYTPDGKRIVFTRTRLDHGRHVLARIVTNLRGDHVRRITPWVSAP